MGAKDPVMTKAELNETVQKMIDMTHDTSGQDLTDFLKDAANGK